MDRVNHICLRASYSEWVHTKLLDAICEFAEETTDPLDNDLHAVLTLMNQLVIADTIWLKRFVSKSPVCIDVMSTLHLDPVNNNAKDTLNHMALSHHRQLLDQTITRWSSSVSVRELDSSLHYYCTEGNQQIKNFFSVIMHFFNHQAFLRGKIIALLSMKNIHFHVSDLLVPHSSQLEI